ncbi:hypothetical protein K439DRAFT_759432 [Ramaria rubella]|nr:hypothetical protein K439DRAFT_759432 [Ramaria rubella]
MMKRRLEGLSDASTQARRLWWNYYHLRNLKTPLTAKPTNTTEQPGEKNTSVTVDNSIIRETLISSKPGDDVSMSMSIESLCSPQTLIALDSGNIEGSVPFSSSLCPSEPNPTAAHADEQPNIHGTEGQDALPEPAPSALVDVRVPRILLAKVGASAPSLMDASFELDDRLVAAVRRHPRPSDPDDLHMRLYLTCIPAIAAEKAHRDLPPNSTPSSLAECVSQIDVTWPPPGTFYVSLNEDGPGTASYTDKFFGSASPPLDISNAVLPGTNTIRFIQLADLSQRIFLILTILVNEEEAKRRSNPIKVRFMP